MKKEISVPNGIIFVYDIGNKSMVVPEYVPNHPVACNMSCVSIATLPEVDGNVVVYLDKLFGTEITQKYKEVFSGKINTPSKTLSVSLPEEEALLTIQLDDEISKISILLNDWEFPSEIFVMVS